MGFKEGSLPTMWLRGGGILMANSQVRAHQMGVQPIVGLEATLSAMHLGHQAMYILASL